MHKMGALLQPRHSPSEDVIEKRGGALSWASVLLEDDGDHAVEEYGGIRISTHASSFGMLQFGLGMLILTFSQTSVPLASEARVSAVGTARASSAAG